jgi:hypothetical protein
VNSEESNDESVNNSVLKGLQDGLSQYFTPSNRRKSRNSFTVPEDLENETTNQVLIYY